MKFKIILILACLFSSPLLATEKPKRGPDITTKTIDLPSFNSISVNSNYTVYLKQTNKQEVSVEVLTEIYELSEFKVENGVLHVNVERKKDTKSKSVWSKIEDIKIAPTMKLYVSVKDIHDLKVNGGGKIIGENSIASNELDLSVTGSGNIDLDIKGSEIKTVISGSGSINLKGYASENDITLSGSGSLHAFDCELEEASVKTSGSGLCEVNVTNLLEAEIYGTGTVKHKGSTKKVESKLYGSGTIERAY